jgi:cystathionine beta-lyase
MTRPPRDPAASLRPSTRLVTHGRNPAESFGFVNTPPYRGSTVLYPDAESCLNRTNRFTYGRRGNPTSEQLQHLWNDLESAAGTVICPSGASACATALLSVLSAGDHLLMTDSVYLPTRQVCDTVLKRMNIETTYYDPLIGEGIAALIRENTRAIYTESPGSQSFEVQDIPAIVRAAKARGVSVLMDNTWATPLLFKPLDYGVDLSIQAATKYPTGHSDVLIGLVAANNTHWPRLLETHGALGVYLGPDDVYLTLRGLRTMELRLRDQGAAALKVAHWFAGRPEVARVLHPALPSCPGHEIWKRDFSGSSSLFSIVLHPASRPALIAFLDSLSLFGMGYSWGGFESLVVPFDCTTFRTATRWTPEGPCLRFQIGLEAVEDLIADLDHAFQVMAATG